MANVLLRAGGHLAVWLYRATGGRVGGSARGVPVGLLTTTGRKSGLPRTTPVSYGRDGDRLVVVGTAGGSARTPAWAVNLRADPHARFEVGRASYGVLAHPAEGAERERLWLLMTTAHPSFLGYEKKTDRVFPVFALERTAELSRQ